jgi:hypothetical protein
MTAPANDLDEITQRVPLYNPSILAEVVYQREESERRNAAKRRQWMEANRGRLLEQLCWCVPEAEWHRVRLR